MIRAEEEWVAAITSLGCIACLITGRGFVPGVVHHCIDEGGRRRGHLFTICLCDPGHHKGAPKRSGEVSRHPNRAAFEERYGTEGFLLEVAREGIKIAGRQNVMERLEA